MMRHTQLVTLLLLAACLPNIGCRALSQVAFGVGRALDPDIGRCASPTYCPLCGEHAAPHPGAPNFDGYSQCAHCGGGTSHPPPHGIYPNSPGYSGTHLGAAPNNPQMVEKLAELEKQTQHSKEMLAEMTKRNTELIQVRKAYKNIQDQVRHMQGELMYWDNESKKVQASLRKHELQRAGRIEVLSNTLNRAVDSFGSETEGLPPPR